MIILPPLNSIEVVTSSAAPLDSYASFIDVRASDGLSLGMGKQTASIVSATTTTILAAPSALNARHCPFFALRNRDASLSNTTTIRIDVGGVKHELFKTALTAGYTLQFTEKNGFEIVVPTPAGGKGGWEQVSELVLVGGEVSALLTDLNLTAYDVVEFELIDVKPRTTAAWLFGRPQFGIGAALPTSGYIWNGVVAGRTSPPGIHTETSVAITNVLPITYSGAGNEVAAETIRQGVTGTLRIAKPASTSLTNTPIRINTMWQRTTDYYSLLWDAVGWYGSAGLITGMGFGWFTGSTFERGTIRVHGRRK